MGCPKIWAVLVAVAVAVLAAATTGTNGQSTTSCAAELLPCAGYVNSTNPPSSCCTPLRNVVLNELPCLCNLYNTPGLAASLHINSTQAVLLVSRCGIPTSGLDSCVNGSAPTGSPPTATPGSNDNNGASKIIWTGMSTIFLFWISIMVY